LGPPGGTDQIVIPILAFDVECVPDVAGIRRVFGLPPDLDDAAVCEWFAQKRRGASSSGSDFTPHYLQQVVAISCALRNETGFRVWSIGEVEDPEPELIRRFFDGIEKLTPQLVSWNGGGFDLPVLQHRALIHGVAAGRYWEWGDEDKEFRFNNYLGRFHTRHIDLMDVLAGFQFRANAPLDAMSRLCGFPGKLGMDGSEVAGAVARGELREVRDYCETDVVNTLLLYQRFRLMRGELAAGEYAKEIGIVRDKLVAADAPHWKAFVAAWDAAV